jgi:predicted ATP-grasp superfamily ATP-dependent carboligase
MHTMSPRFRPGRCRVLLSEGSSLSARQTLYALGRLGYQIDAVDPQPLFCFARYSRYVGAVHRCPPFTRDPVGYVNLLLELFRSQRYDVLLPTHDQVFLLSRVRDLLCDKIALPAPEFAAMERLQSKAGFLRLLKELNLPHPPTMLVRTRAELEAAATTPCFIKQDYATAGRGVWHVHDKSFLQSVADQLEQAGLLDGKHEVLVQQPAPGTLCVAQSVFQHGRLVAVHTYESRAPGVGGSARARVSVDHPAVRVHLATIGGALNWHGAMAIDYLHDVTTGRPAYIDANPRIGETLNATLSGVNLCDAVVRIALGEQVNEMPCARVGVRTHSVVMTMLAEAEDGKTRREILAEVGKGWQHTGVYRDSEDELTRPRDDVLSLLPAAVVIARLMFSPRQGQRIVRGTVENYALTEPAARAIRELDLHRIQI